MTDRLAGLVQEQHSVRGSLLNHVRVGVVAVRPRAGVLVVGVRDQAREVGLLVARSGIVEGEEGERNTGDRDVEASLSQLSVCCLPYMRGRRHCGSCSSLNVRRSSRCRRSGARRQHRGWHGGAGSGIAHRARSAELLFEGAA